MKILDPGHLYELASKNGEVDAQRLQFIQKGFNQVGEFVTIRNGTTNEEVICVLINRLVTLNRKLPCTENTLAIKHLNEALYILQNRTATRVKQNENTPLAHHPV